MKCSIRKKFFFRERFTLIELLVVTAVIAILAGMLLPVLGKARESADFIKCRNNSKQLTMVLLMYANDYHNWLIRDYRLGSDNSRVWPLLLQRGQPNSLGYVKQDYSMSPKGIFTCRRLPWDNPSGGLARFGVYGMGKHLQGEKAKCKTTPDEGVSRLDLLTQVSRSGYLAESLEYAFGPFMLRHRRQTESNLAFLDGHAEPFRKKYVAPIAWYSNPAFPPHMIYYAQYGAYVGSNHPDGWPWTGK